MMELEFDMLGGIKYKSKQLDMEDYRRIMGLRRWMVGLAFPGYLDIDIDVNRNVGGYTFLRPDTVYVLINEEEEFIYRYNNRGELNEKWVMCNRICSYLEFIQKLFDAHYMNVSQLYKQASEELAIEKNTIFERFLIRIVFLALELYSEYDFYPDPYELYDVLATCENKTALAEIMQEAVKILPERRFSL